MLREGVDLAGVNLMTMDYGDSRPADRDMVGATEDALRASERQLDDLYRRAGTPLGQGIFDAKLPDFFGPGAGGLMYLSRCSHSA